MNIGKKITLLVVLSLILMLSTATSAIKESQEIKTEQADECTLCFSKTVTKNVRYIDGKYPVLKEFPPKTEEQLALIDPNPQPTMMASDLPSQFSWKSYGGDWTTGARDQQSCGSCWAFSAIGAFEAAIDIASGNPSTNKDLSEQYVLSCLSGAGSCSGGWMSEALDYIQSESSGAYGNGINGCPIESCMPYQAVDYIPCSDKCEDWDYYTTPQNYDNKLFQIASFGVTTTSEDNPGDWALLKSWIMTYGPLSVDIVADGFGSWGNSHHSSTDVYEYDNNGWTNHGVVLCGWVDDDQILNGGYWIIKNSWGAGWGYGGFGNIAYGCNGVATRDCAWVLAKPWETSGNGGGGPIDIDIAVFADFDYQADDGSKYPHLGEEIEFIDNSDGDVSTREWDFDGDGVTDSTKKRPTWTYYEEGDYEVTLTVTNQWGISSDRTRIVGAKEIWPPIAICNPENYPEHPGDNDLEIIFDARSSHDRDGGRIVSYHWDFGDGTTADEQTLYHTFPQPDEIYEVTLTVTDNDGAAGSVNCIVKIDQNVPPETTIHHGFGGEETLWYKDTERVSFTATDWTSVIFTYFRIDGGEWERYIVEEQQYYPIGSEGMHTVEAYSIDYYRNEETPKFDTFGIDKTNPTVDINLEGEKNQDWYISPVTVTLSGSDELSGLDKIYYKINQKSWKEYNGPFILDPEEQGFSGGSIYLSYYSTDKAGNIRDDDAVIYFEPAPSVPKITGERTGESGTEYEYTFMSTDYYPEGDQIYYLIDWGDGSDSGWLGPYESGEELTLTHSWSEGKSYLIKAKAKDNYDAESDWSTYTVSMPRIKQRFTILEDILEMYPNFYLFLKYFFKIFSFV